MVYYIVCCVILYYIELACIMVYTSMLCHAYMLYWRSWGVGGGCGRRGGVVLDLVVSFV